MQLLPQREENDCIVLIVNIKLMLFAENQRNSNKCVVLELRDPLCLV